MVPSFILSPSPLIKSIEQSLYARGTEDVTSVFIRSGRRRKSSYIYHKAESSQIFSLRRANYISHHLQHDSDAETLMKFKSFVTDSDKLERCIWLENYSIVGLTDRYLVKESSVSKLAEFRDNPDRFTSLELFSELDLRK